MADRQFTCPVPRTAQMPKTMIPATLRLERVALKWRELAERRRDHFFELYRSGRWTHYYDSDLLFLTAMRQAVYIADRWAAIAPRPEEIEQQQAASEQASQEALPALEFMQPKDLAA